MSSWLQSKLQSKLLRYGLRYVLSQSGLLDDQAIDLDNLDISVGRQNVIELRDVHLNLEQVAKLTYLPPSLRLESARVLLLRLTVPADFYQSSIIVQVDGVEVVVRLQEEDETPTHPESRNRSPTHARTPQHRKTQRRIHSPPPYNRDGLPASDHDLHIPTSAEIAQSFLKQESLQEREELEATWASKTTGMEESIASEGSESGDIGTGTGITMPGILARFLQGIADRFELHVQNVQVKIESFIPDEASDRHPLTLRLNIEAVDLSSLKVSAEDETQGPAKTRNVNANGISLHVLSTATIFTDFPELPPQSVSFRNRSFAQSTRDSDESFASAAEAQTRRSSNSTNRSPSPDRLQFSKFSRMSSPPEYSPSSPVDDAQMSTASTDADRFADAIDDEPDVFLSRSSELDIQAGDDNISWGSRRSKASPPTDDLWRSMVSEDDLPDSLIMTSERSQAQASNSSRGGSPFAARERRGRLQPNSNFQGSGSWPRLDENSHRHRQLTGPGSWPTLDQSQHSAFEPLAQVLTAASDETTDNKKAALEQAEIEERLAEPSSLSPAMLEEQEVEEEGEEKEDSRENEENMSSDMLKSRVFSHAEAQSMYMSAMTNSPPMDMPGGWGTDTQSESPASPDDQLTRSENDANELDDQASGNSTPRAETSRAPTPTRSDLTGHRVARELLCIDWVSISLPVEPKEPERSDPEEKQSPSSFDAQSVQAARAVPGAFSIYSESSKRRETSSTYGEISSTPWATHRSADPLDTDSSEQCLDVSIGTVYAQVDFATGRLLHAFVIKTSPLLKTYSTSSPETAAKTSKSAVQRATPAVSLHVQNLSLSLKDRPVSAASARRPDPSNLSPDIVNVVIKDIDLRVSSGMHLEVGVVKVLLGGRDLLNFAEDNNNFFSSDGSSQSTSAIDVVVKRDKSLANGRPVTEVNIRTTCIVLLLDLGTIDDAFDSFGGLSGILELGGSVLSESGSGSPVAAKRSKGVRFASDAEDKPKADLELKANLRIAGITITLNTAPCSAVIQTGTLKAVSREIGIIATVDRVLLTGPFLRGQNSHAPISVELANGRLEYHLKPDEGDLERLISLLVPSKDKYDNDKDILIDTLLRQRRKGGILRIVFTDFKLSVDSWDCVSTLEELSKEVSKLSAVTKYLPEDDRPGVLTLVRIKISKVRLPVNKRFGTLSIALQDLHLAHVGLPSLLAFSISTINASQTNGPELVHALISLTGSEALPMVMARMLGDEEDPTIKLKIFNACVEYSVPILLDLTSLDQEVEIEDLVTEVVQSIVGLTMDERIDTQASDPSGSVKKSTNLKVLVHDSAIGLTPRTLQSKALFVLTDTIFTTAIPPEETLNAKLDMRLTSIFITDRFIHNSDRSAQRTMDSASTTEHLASVLKSQGYVPVGSMRAAIIVVRAENNAEAGSKMVVVDAKKGLVLLETCADSTQTLIATLGALAPPAPPSKQSRYLTEPMTIEDMMKSFSGEPFEKPASPPETLFDVEVDQDDEPDMLLGVSGLIETADLLAESEMNSSLYGPTSGVFGMDRDDDESTVEEDYPKTVESLLEEEDPFEMPSSPSDMHLDDAALLRDLKRQCKPAVRDEPVDLGQYEIEDLGYDALGSGQQALGTQHRFNAPYPGSRGDGKAQSNLPFTLRLRDCHVNWHIFDGYDWQHTRDGISEAVEQVETKAEERRAKRQQSLDDRDDGEPVIGDLLFNSIYIAIPSDHDAQELRRRINRTIDDKTSETESVPVSRMSRPSTYSASGQPRGQRKRRRLKLGRSKIYKIAFDLRDVAADVMVFPPGAGDAVSSIDVRVKDLEVFDNLVATSAWHKFLTCQQADSHTREMSKPMFHIQLDNVKTLEGHSASEMVLKVSVLPLRLHVDQDALDFITRFFEFKDKSIVSEPEGEQPFIQRVEIDTVDLCLDYKPKKIDYAGLRSGRTTEFMNFVGLDSSNIRLQHAIVYGLRGFDTLHQTLNDVWMPDIQRNQLPTILAGLAPVRSLVNIGSGVRDVVAIPIREYKKDGRIVRSIQKGAFQFGKTTASELARLGAKVALGTQTALSNAEHFLAPDAAAFSRRQNSNLRTFDQGWNDIDSDDEEHERRAVSAYANQPLGVLTGLRSARRYLELDLLTAKDALIAVRGEVLESSSPGGAAAAVARHAPTVILRPIIGATRAVGTTLLGVGNQIDRGNVRKAEDKYKPR